MPFTTQTKQLYWLESGSIHKSNDDAVAYFCLCDHQLLSCCLHQRQCQEIIILQVLMKAREQCCCWCNVNSQHKNNMVLHDSCCVVVLPDVSFCMVFLQQQYEHYTKARQEGRRKNQPSKLHGPDCRNVVPIHTWIWVVSFPNRFDSIHVSAHICTMMLGFDHDKFLPQIVELSTSPYNTNIISQQDSTYHYNDNA